jgi:hypothetical protein
MRFLSSGWSNINCAGVGTDDMGLYTSVEVQSVREVLYTYILRRLITKAYSFTVSEDLHATFK